MINLTTHILFLWTLSGGSGRVYHQTEDLEMVPRGITSHVNKHRSKAFKYKPKGPL